MYNEKMVEERINEEDHYWKYILKAKKYFEGNIRRNDYADSKMTYNIYYKTYVREEKYSER